MVHSLKDDFSSISIREDGGHVDQKSVKWLDSEEAFENSIRVGVIKNLQHVDPIKFFEDAKAAFVIEISKTLKANKHNLKIYTVLEATYEKQ